MNDDDLVRLYRLGMTPRTPTREQCVSPEALLGVVERSGSEHDRTEAINHAMGCADCAEELELLRSTRITRERERIPHAGRALAASIVLVIGLGYFGILRSRSGRVIDDDLTRSGAGDVRLVSPDTDARGGTLTWHSVPGALGYTMELRRDDGTLITRATTSDTVIAVPDSVRATTNDVAYWGVVARLADGTELRSVIRRIRINP